MSVLFLLEAAKKTDLAFHAAPHSTAHTVHSAKRDIDSMVEHLLEKKVTTQTEGRHSPVFTDPTEQGWQKLSTTTWLKERLSAHHQDEEGEHLEHEEVALDYEISAVI